MPTVVAKPYLSASMCTMLPGLGTASPLTFWSAMWCSQQPVAIEPLHSSHSSVTASTSPPQSDPFSSFHLLRYPSPLIAPFGSPSNRPFVASISLETNGVSCNNKRIGKPSFESQNPIKETEGNAHSPCNFSIGQARRMCGLFAIRLCSLRAWCAGPWHRSRCLCKSLC